MIEFLQELLVQSCSMTLGFVAGTLWMRENYLRIIRRMDQTINFLSMELMNKGDMDACKR